MAHVHVDHQTLRRYDLEGGFIQWEARPDGTVEIRDIHVDSERRCQGVGRKLVAAVLRALEPNTRVWAVTGASNLIAQQFWEKCGFRDVSPIRRFYGGEQLDAIMYIRFSQGAV